MTTPTFSPDAMKRAVPAFATPESEVFDLILPFFQAALALLHQELGLVDALDSAAPHVERLCYLMGCRRAIPHLDLVLTPFGFGVVSNQNHAPASPHRVQALAEELRADESRSRDALLFALLDTPWAAGAAARRAVDSLLFCPTLLRRHGVTLDGAEVYHREARALAPDIQAARREAAALLSPELMAELIRRRRLPIETERDLYDELTAAVTHFMAAIITARRNRTPDPDLPRAREALLHFVRTHRSRLPEYADSTTAQAHDLRPYQNEQDHTTFFFG